MRAWRGKLTVYRGVGLRGDLIEFRSHDYFDWPLSLDAFVAGASDYDIISDELYCPCGVTLPSWDTSAGDMLRKIYAHCEAAGHPKPRYDP